MNERAMLFDQSVERDLHHSRHVECNAYLRKDLLWDIEGSIVDTKTVELNTGEKTVKPGSPLHRMMVRVTVDRDFVILDAQAITLDAPFGACLFATDSYKRMAGLRIGPGFTKELRERIGSRDACTHITELMGPIATTAFQAIRAWLSRTCGPVDRKATEEQNKRIMDSCYGQRSEVRAMRQG
jgi:hypothetical protein